VRDEPVSVPPARDRIAHRDRPPGRLLGGAAQALAPVQPQLVSR
jgi:hypothetical protein